MLSRRQFMLSLASLAITPSLSGCAWLSNQPIAIAGHVWVGYEPTFLARAQGWLDNQQVSLLETHSSSESMHALATGKVQGAMLTLDEVLRARAAGLPLSVVMVFDVSAGADIVLAHYDIQTILDLKGERIGFEQSSVGELLLAIVLNQAGLSKQDVTLVPLPVEQQFEAWRNNEVDAVISYEPTASKMLNQGAVRLFDTTQTSNLIVDVLAIRTDVLNGAHAQAIRHLISSHFRGLAHLSKSPQDAAYRMSARLGLPAQDVLAAFEGLVMTDLANNLRLLSGNTPVLLSSAEKLSDIMSKFGQIAQPDSLDGLIDSDYLPLDAELS
jgi:NitT/TauT family transport system substrate-binding protein